MPLVPAIIVTVITMLAVVVLIELWSRWMTARLVSRALDRARHRERNAHLEPESRFIARLTDSEVVCERPDGRVERVAWSDLQKVEVVTTSDGPFVPDVFWVLHGTTEGCAIPQGATGEKELMDRLFALPGFNNGAVIEAMTCVLDRRFLCWEKESFEREQTKSATDGHG